MTLEKLILPSWYDDEDLMQMSAENPELRFERNADGTLETMCPIGGISGNRELRAGARLYIVQEFIEGTTLEQLQEYGAFNEVKIRQLLKDILPVLQFVHEQKVLHRDIKPPNIIIRVSERKPVLIDFGVAMMALATVVTFKLTRHRYV